MCIRDSFGIAAAFDEAGFLQAIHHAADGDGLHVQQVGQFGLADALVLVNALQRAPLHTGQAQMRGTAVKDPAKQAAEVGDQVADGGVTGGSIHGLSLIHI